MTCLDTLPPPPLAESCIVVLETKRLVLRAPQLVDGKAVAALANDRRVAENTARIPHPYRLADAEKWIGGANAEPGTLTYLITLADDTIIGSCSLGIDDGPVPDIGYWLGMRETLDRQRVTSRYLALIVTPHRFDGWIKPQAHAWIARRTQAGRATLQRAALTARDA